MFYLGMLLLVTKLECDFEDDKPCGMQSESSKTTFQRVSNFALKSESLPVGDHTTGYGNGLLSLYYFFCSNYRNQFTEFCSVISGNSF